MKKPRTVLAWAKPLAGLGGSFTQLPWEQRPHIQSLVGGVLKLVSKLDGGPTSVRAKQPKVLVIALGQSTYAPRFSKAKSLLKSLSIHMDTTIATRTDKVNNISTNTLFIPLSLNKWCSMGMTAAKNRRAWVVAFTPVRGSIRQFAERTGVDETYISNIRAGRRSMGDAIARRIEKKLGMALGELDQPPPKRIGETIDELTYKLPQLGGPSAGDRPDSETLGEKEEEMDIAGRVMASLMEKLSPQDKQQVVDFALQLAIRQPAEKKGT